MGQWSARIGKNIFLKNVLTIMTGTVAAQAINMLAIPVITRLYGPEAFGILGGFTAIAMALIPISALSYPMAIILASSDEEAIEIGAFSIVLGGGAFFLACVVVLVLQLDFFSFDGALGQNKEIIFFLTLVMFDTVLIDVARRLLARKGSYRKIRNTEMGQAIFSNGAKILGASLAASGFMLVFAYVIGYIFMAWRLIRYEFAAVIWKLRSCREINWRVLLRKYIDFPVYRAPQILINAFAEGMPVLFLGSLYGPQAAGFYSLGRVAMGIPTRLIGQAINDVFYPRFAEEKSIQRRKQFFLMSTVALGVLGLLPYGVVFLFGDLIFSFLFGEQWLIAGQYAKWLAVWLFMTLVTRPAIAVIPVLRCQKALLIFEIFSLFIRAGAIYLGFSFWFEPLKSVEYLGVGNFVIYACLLCFVFIRVGREV